MLEFLFHSLCIMVLDTLSVEILCCNMTVMLVLATLGVVAIYNRWCKLMLLHQCQACKCLPDTDWDVTRHDVGGMQHSLCQ